MKFGSLQFDPDGHVYTLAVATKPAVVIPSVSDIIRPLTDMSGIPKARLEFARDRGKTVHRACELLCRGDLDTESLDERIVGYVAAWERFCEDHEPAWAAIEEPDWHEKFLYAGTPDRVGTCLDGKRRVRVIVDMKATYALNPAVQVQLSGYDLLTPQPADELWSVRLKGDGTYELTVHKPAHATFLACLNIYRWMEKNKCLPPKF